MKLAALVFAGFLVGCAQTPAAESATQAHEYASTPIPAALVAEVRARWSSQGLPTAGCGEAPEELVADAEMFQALCGEAPFGPSGASACQADGVIVLFDMVRTPAQLARSRAHELAHWLVECSGVCSHKQNRAHSVTGVWDGPGDYVLAPWYQ